MALLWVAGVLIFLRPGPQPVPLTDGTTVRLRALTTGTNEYTTIRPWHRLARRVLPTRFQGWVPEGETSQCGGSRTSATYWFEILNASNFAVWPSWYRAEIITREGQVIPSDAGPSCGSPYSVILESFPRRERDFRYRITEGRSNSVLGEMRLPNPFREPFPEWTPEKLPITRTNGELAVTLLRFRKLMQELPGGRTNVILQPEVRCTWNGMPTTDWQVGPSLLEDATGNRVNGLYPQLPHSEKVWRWRTWMEHRVDSPAVPDQTVVITNLPVPQPGEWTEINLATNIGQATFWFGAFSGPATFTLSNSQFFRTQLPIAADDFMESHGRHGGAYFSTNTVQSPTLIAGVRWYYYSDRARILFRDQDGRVLPTLPERTNSMILCSCPDNGSGLFPVGEHRILGLLKNSPGIDARFYRPILGPSVKRITIEATVHRRREVSFYIAAPREEWIGTANNASTR